MTTIQKVAVLGSGVMGSGIAAHIANAGIPVMLLDIVPKDASDRNVLAKTALEKLAKAKPAAFSHPKKMKLVTPGNFEDDLAKLGEVDWIIEAVVERLDIKHDVYRKIDAVRKAGSVVSSNTSTLPLHALIEGQSDAFKNDFLITHFFNPPRYMRLLEVVGSAKARAVVEQFADVKLGKGVVACKDTPGFIANRIGIYWMMVGLLEAMRLGISVEEADLVMGKPLGFPKTGVFGLFDLVGIDLMPHIGKAMMQMLPESDAFRTMYQEPDLIKKMIADGYTGRKGKGGFYRLNEKKKKEVLNLKTGDYAPEKKAALESVEAAKGGLAKLMEHKDIGGQYAWAVMSKTLAYAASLIPEISDDIVSVDKAMKTGFAWKYGPFELMDKLGTAWLAQKLENVPPILKAANGRKFYDGLNYLTLQGEYAPIQRGAGVLLLSDAKFGKKPVAKNGSASIWDLGDGIACLEFTSKMNSIDTDVLGMMQKSIDIVKGGFKGLIIGGDGDNFSVGANLGLVMFLANIAAWKTVSDVVRQGQMAVMGLKYAPFPVVSALHGMALGGGCETNLHCDRIQAHLESYIGLVEVGVGLIPGWGGCKEMLWRHIPEDGKGGAMPGIAKAFEMIATAKTAESADLARDMGILRADDKITMNRERLLQDAKNTCLALVENYTPPTQTTRRLPGRSGAAALNMAVDNFVANGMATPHDSFISRHLAVVLSGGNTDQTEEVTEQDILNLEHDVFVELVKHPLTIARIEHMLEKGKPLRN